MRKTIKIENFGKAEHVQIFVAFLVTFSVFSARCFLLLQLLVTDVKATFSKTKHDKFCSIQKIIHFFNEIEIQYYQTLL